MILKRSTLALLAGAICGFSSTTQAASCCGGGSSSSLVLPKFAQSMVSVSTDWENYDGFWDGGRNYTPDPPGSSLNQYRLNVGYAQRLASRWQASVSIPYVWNSNQYAGLDSSTQGLGDTTLSAWYEAFDGVTCIWKVRKWEDLKPAIYLGAALTVPTGISPYDDVNNSFDITGRGLYRLDASVLLEKTIYPWNASLLYVYGKHLERSVNQEYGKYIEPYKKQLGDRQLMTASAGYTYFLESMDTLTFTLAYSQLEEGKGAIDGRSDTTSEMEKNSIAGTLAFSTMDRDWVVKGTWSHAMDQDGWGKNFPVTDVYSLGVSHVFR